ncbi:MAG: replication factor C large subunit [Candidatus Aenigmarchaeota archaeon]|nr:replication factor C large subunit [Candidatus Aenigmarchaeota archaeon]MDW8149210.1 replication factor C large subunit [Candidatus Aenigmarchaeota archaeon]
MWILKYRPSSLNDFVDQKEAIEKFKNWYNNWKPKSKAALLYGKPGTGKTCFVEAFAKDNNLELVQMNASDFRTEKAIEKVFGSAANVKSIFKKSKIFLIDEIDGLAGKEDVGGVKAIIDIIKSSQYPIVLTANDIYDPKLKQLREFCLEIEFKPLKFWDVKKKLKEICNKENISFEEKIIEEIAKKNEGDLRASINDLEIIACGKNKIIEDDLKILSERDREMEIFNALNILFKTTSLTGARTSFINVDLDTDTLFLWIYENIPNEYEKPEEINKAYEYLAKADLFRARIVFRNYWKLMRYMNDLMTIGVSLAKKEVYKKFTKFSFPSVLRKLSLTKKEREKELVKLKELSEKLNCSTQKIRKEYLPYLKFL